MWNLPPPPGFQGLHPDKPLHVYERYLPHWRQEGATYFVTFRLADSLPQAKLRELAALKDEWKRLHPPPRSNEVLEQLARETARRVDGWLDQGFGSCVLKEPSQRAFLVEALHHFDLRSTTFPSRKKSATADLEIESRYELGCYVVMPNHVHAIVRPLGERTQPIEEILGSWKQYSAHRINRRLQTSGELWQAEAFDRIIRDEEHLWRAIQYIGRNPLRAQLPDGTYALWIRPEWESLGWRFEQTP